MNHDVTGLARFVNLDQERRELEERGDDLLLSPLFSHSLSLLC